MQSAQGIQSNHLHNKKKGRFIVFEGLDGSGKSTQINLLKQKLTSLGHPVYATAEPTNSSTGGLIRDALCGDFKRGPAELAALFLADRIAHNINPVWGINKFLNSGFDVICDRYYYSSLAYQGMDTDLDWVMNINLQCPQIIKPDLCIFLDVDYYKCKQRIDSERPYLEIFEENEETLNIVRNKFLEVFNRLKDSENIVIIDADRMQDDIAAEIFSYVTAIIR